MPSRNGSQEIDAIYFNPAGVMSLRDGFHLMFHNHFQFVKQTLESRGLNTIQTDPQTYSTDIKEYAFPLFYIAYKKKKIAASFFVTPAIGGGGSSIIENLPFGEYPIADFTSLTKFLIKEMVDKHHNTNYSDIKYDYDFEFSGLSFSPSFQFNLAYKLNQYISLSAGARMTYYISTATGSLSNLRFNNEALGLSLSPENYINHIVDNVDVQYPDEGRLLATLVGSLPLELEIDARQTDISYTPIIGLNFNWHDRWFIGLKYDHRTAINLTTTVKDGKDGAGAFVDGKQVRSDIPGVFAAGLTFKPNDRLTLAAGHRLVFMKRANLNGREEFLVSNYKEFDIAFEYKVLPRLKVSAGGTYRTIRFENEYYTSVDYLLPAYTGGAGFKTEMSDRISIEFGFLYTRYVKARYNQQVEIFGGLASLLLGEELPDFINEPLKRKVEYEMTGQAIVASLGVNFWMGSIEENRKGRQNRIYNVRVERKYNLIRRVNRRDCKPNSTKRHNMRLNRKRSAVRIERRNRQIEKFDDIED